MSLSQSPKPKLSFTCLFKLSTWVSRLDSAMFPQSSLKFPVWTTHKNFALLVMNQIYTIIKFMVPIYFELVLIFKYPMPTFSFQPGLVSGKNDWISW